MLQTPEGVRAALAIQHAKCLRHIILPSVACLALTYFSTLSQKQSDLWEKKLLNIQCVF